MTLWSPLSSLRNWRGGLFWERGSSRPWCAVIAGLALCVLAGCAQHMPAAHAPVAIAASSPSEVLAGASRVDITPPPGPSTFGHGPGARVAVGYYSRLYCRAFYFEAAGKAGSGFAIVSCELPQISTLLQRSAAARLHGLPTSRLMLVATHTHAGPGHYFESESLGGATSAHYPGFDPEMVAFLSDRIAQAVNNARLNKRPARLRWLSDEVWGLTRNRSLSAFRANAHRATSPGAVNVPPEAANLGEEQRAIDPKLRVLQVEWLDRATEQALSPIGMLTFFAMHPTVVRNRNRSFGGDVFGVTSRVLEQELRREAMTRRGSLDCAHGFASETCIDPVAAMINTNEGDMVPVWSSGDVDEAKSVGIRLASNVWQTRAACDEPPRVSPKPTTRCGTWQSKSILDLRYIEAKLPGARLLAGAIGTDRKALCDDAELGLAASLGGADHPTTLEALLSSGESTVDYDREHCQAPKVRFLGRIQELFLRGSFPEQVPIAVLRIDGTWISFLPAELTITAGARVNQAVQTIASASDPHATAVVAGLANGYIQYVATPEEYNQQRYEGGSTLYGPASAPYLAQVCEYLTRHMRGEQVETQLAWLTRTRLGEAEAFEFDTAPERARLWRSDWDDELAEVSERGPLKVCTVPNTSPPALCFRWIDGGPSRVGLTHEPWLSIVPKGGSEPLNLCALLEPLAPATSVTCDPGARLDDRGLDFATRIIARRGNGWIWSTMFRPSSTHWRALTRTQELEFVAEAPGAGPIRSLPFTAAPPPEACTPRELAQYCNTGF